MAAVTAASLLDMSPGLGRLMTKLSVTSATAADTIDLSLAANGGFATVDLVLVTQADAGLIAASTLSGTTLTIGAGPAADALEILVVGQK